LRRSKRSGLILKIDFEKAYDKVRWSFLEQIMVDKGFPTEWILWVMDNAKGESVCQYECGKV
jgi:hypothetical protein